MTNEEAKKLKAGDVVISTITNSYCDYDRKFKVVELDDGIVITRDLLSGEIFSFAPCHIRRPETIEDVYEGALLKQAIRNCNIYYMRVLGVCGQAVFTTISWLAELAEETTADDSPCAIADLKRGEWQLVKTWEEEKPKSKAEQIGEFLKEKYPAFKGGLSHKTVEEIAKIIGEEGE